MRIPLRQTLVVGNRGRNLNALLIAAPGISTVVGDGAAMSGTVRLVSAVVEIDAAGGQPTEGRAVTLGRAVAENVDVPDAASHVLSAFRAQNPGLGLNTVVSGPLVAFDLEALMARDPFGVPRLKPTRIGANNGTFFGVTVLELHRARIRRASRAVSCGGLENPGPRLGTGSALLVACAPFRPVSDFAIGPSGFSGRAGRWWFITLPIPEFFEHLPEVLSVEGAHERIRHFCAVLVHVEGLLGLLHAVAGGATVIELNKEPLSFTRCILAHLSALTTGVIEEISSQDVELCHDLGLRRSCCYRGAIVNQHPTGFLFNLGPCPSPTRRRELGAQ